MPKRISKLAISTPLRAKRKRKSISNEDNLMGSTSFLTSLRTNELSNDELERSERRNSASMQELSVSEYYTKEAIMTHLEICMKLYASNKIDSKNIWAVKIIDYMSAMVRDNIFETDTLKMATNTMEVGSKVFGLRVDCVHAQTLQLAGNMARNTELENEENEIAYDNAPVDLENPAKAKRTKKPRILEGDEPSIVKDVNTLFAPIKQMPKNVFNIYQGNVPKGFNQYLTSSILMNFDGRFMFMSNEKYFKTDEDLVDYDETILHEPLPSQWDEEEDIDIDNMELFPMFKDFCIDNDEELNNNEVNDDGIYYDQNGGLLAEVDGSIHDPFEANDSQDDFIEEEVNVAHRRPIIGNVIPKDSVYPYIFNTMNDKFNNVVISLWAGPYHWKVKWIKQRAPTFTGAIMEIKPKKKRVKKKEAVKLQFDENEKITSSVKHMKPFHYKKSKRKHFRKPLQYITDSMQPVESFRKRYISPLDHIPEEAIGNEVRDATEEANCENEMVSQIYDQQNHVHQIDDCDLTRHEEEIVLDDLDLPIICHKTIIGFEKHPKKMNMKLLKWAVWSYLVDINTKHIRENQENILKVIGEKHFKELYSNIPKRINQTMREALSSPLAFSALLHLANENNLLLIGVEAMNNIIIRQN